MSFEPTIHHSDVPSVSSKPTITLSEAPSMSSMPSVSSAPSLTSAPSHTAWPSTSKAPSFAPSALGSIGPNIVFNDLDEDGHQDPDEGPLSNVTVQLYCFDSDRTEDFVLTDMVLTDSNGMYEFTQVHPALCYISVVPEVDSNDSYVFSPIVPNGNQINQNGTSPVAEINYNENIDDWNVGMYLPLANIGPNLIFNDLNKNGYRDVGEEPLPSVDVSLVCTSVDGNHVMDTLTNATGWYEFNDIQPGTCHVLVAPEVDDNDNYVFSPVVEEGNQIYPNGTSPSVEVGYAAIIHCGWDAGMYLPLASVGPNVVFNDVNEDGIQDENEGPVVGVTIALVCDGNTVDTAVSNVNGTYEFTDVQPGECSIQVTPGDPDYSFSPVVTGGNQIDVDGNSPTVTVGYNDTVNTWDVGMYLPPATIGPNVVFDDWNGDGQRDPIEPPMENITVDLYCYTEGGGLWELVDTAVTDSNGNYVFSDVLPGACYIQVTPPYDVEEEANYTFSPITLDGNQIYPNGTSPIVDIDWKEVIDHWDVGMFIPVTLGNKVWDDYNGNGYQEANEPGMAGVWVTLLDVTGNVVVDRETGEALKKLTVEDGSYWFTNLLPGEYKVQFDLPPDYVFAPSPDLQGALLDPGTDFAASIIVNDPELNIGVTESQNLISGRNSTSFDAGIYIPVIVGGVIWDDKNGNGIRDAGEAGLEGAGILVYNSLIGLSDPHLDYVVSGPNGEYDLSLPPGTYVGMITTPSPDYMLSPLANNETNGNDFDPNTMLSSPITLASGQSGVGNFDAGFYEPITVNSFVWEDVNANGILDPDEGGYTAGPLAIKLYDMEGNLANDVNGNPLETQTNPVDGSFSLNDIPPGTYEIEFGSAEGVSFTLQDEGSDDSKDSDVDPATGRATITVESGEYLTDVAAGVSVLPSIGPNRIFVDHNADGVLDEDEEGLADVLVVLYYANGTQAAFTETDTNGDYSFNNLEPGLGYYISVNNDPGFLFSPVVPGGNQISPNEDGIYNNASPTITLGLGDTDTTLLVAMFEPVTVGNRVWNDLNGNGVQDATEPGMEDVVVLLLDGVSGDQVGSGGFTDATGHYLFADELPPSSYKVAFILPDRYVFTVSAKDITPIIDPVDGSLHYDHVTSDVDRDTVIGNMGVTDAKDVKSGDDNLSFDAGMFIPVTVNGTTWHDLNANGIEDEGEPGLGGITVTLYDRDGDIVGTQETAADGVWQFVDFPPGSYTVEITKPAGSAFEISPKPANSTDDSSDFDPETWKTDEFLLMSGESSDGLSDAGMYLPATIGDKVWFDETPNGVQDTEELPFDQPLTIKLFDELGYLVDETESSPTTGLYSFTGVRPGSYELEFILTDEDFQFTIPFATNNTATDSNVSPTTGRASVTVTSGEEKLDVDAGIMDFGPYYPDWTNGVQECTNDGFDPAWLEIQKVNYLYKNKEDCCKNHFWWRMTQCMQNEEFKFYMKDDICDTKIFFEDWEDNSPMDWTETTQFDTLEECCANKFWFDYDGCVSRSPVMFKFEFCVDIQGLVAPADCQSADIYGNVLEDAINDGLDHHHGLSESELHDHDEVLPDQRVLHEDPTSADAAITKVGDVSLAKVSGSTECGGALADQDFTNELTGTEPDIDSAQTRVVNVCGVITVEEEDCFEEACLIEHYEEMVHELEEFVNLGDLTLAINERSYERLPPVPELFDVMARPFTFTTKNLLLPATVTGDLDFQYFHGSDLKSCMKKAVFLPGETPFPTLYECCQEEFSWGVNQCCTNGGGCPEIGVTSQTSDPDLSDREATARYYPTWLEGRLCDSKTSFYIGEESVDTLEECCAEWFPSNPDCLTG